MGYRLFLPRNSLILQTRRGSPPATGVRRVVHIILATLALLVVIEAALQVRSHFRTGDSVINLLFAETRYVEDAQTGLTVLRPNRVFVSNKVVLRANSLGLRSPEIPLARSPGSWRLAVVGASTVMGAYDPDTEQTFPARLEQRLRRDFPERRVEVVNAGIVGYKLNDQRRMLETRIADLHPDLVVLYPGFNDFLDYCQEPATPGRPRHQGLPLVSLPSWLLSVDMLKKNTVALRTPPVRPASMRNPETVDLLPYRAKLEALIGRAAQLGLPLVLATNARAYRRDQPLDEQMKLSETDRYYNHCFDLEGLHVLYDRHNAEIRAAGAAHGIPVVPLDELIPGGGRYFADSHHFSVEAEGMVADALSAFITRNKLLPE